VSLFITACGGGGGGTNHLSTTPYTLTVNSTNPSSGVTITAAPADANGLASGSTSFTLTYNSGTMLALAAPATVGGNTFVSWSGGCTSTTVTCNVTMNANTTVTANYAAPATYTLTVNSANPSSGVVIDVTYPPTTLASQGTTSFTINGTAGTMYGLTAPATASGNTGNTFASWTGCTTSSTVTCNVTLNANTTVTANYTTLAATASNVTVDQSSTGPVVTDQILGMNLAAWYDWPSNASSIDSAFKGAGIKAIRWPGGSWSDDYHWGYQTGSGTLVPSYMCQTASPVTGGWGGYSTFVDFVTAIPVAGPYDLALTANYGTNEACTGGGDPNEAAAWVAAVVSNGITVTHMTVGNEEYGNWETDLHSSPHNPTTYAAAVGNRTSNGYYEQIKTASPNTMVGVVVEPSYAPWDQDVLSGAQYDFVEYHYYPEAPGSESDSFLVNQAAQQLTTKINTIKTELTTAGKPNTPIYVGEIGGPYSDPGKQSWSITQGLYAGQVLGEMMNDGVSRLTWWIGFGNCNTTDPGNQSASLYGWQDFGAYNVFSDGPSDTDCQGAGPIGTMSPTARAFQLFSNVAVSGESELNASVTGDTADVVAYAATHSGGTALVLFNRNETTAEPVTITLSKQSSSTGVTVITYDKDLYDQTSDVIPVWAGPVTTNLGAHSLPLSLTLTPWSLNVVLIQ
jgi:hypothetical protein